MRLCGEGDKRARPIAVKGIEHLVLGESSELYGALGLSVLTSDLAIKLGTDSKHNQIIRGQKYCDGENY